ncbi:MAG: hypothetical protein FWF77_07085 [Defluviitaleaceae bacterium]|nr:hypothetical protein [Defluviitaleaceae bacterium]
MIKQYDHVRLKSGKRAVVVEVWEQGVSYEADIEVSTGNYETETIGHADISGVFVEVETPIAMIA